MIRSSNRSGGFCFTNTGEYDCWTGLYRKQTTWQHLENNKTSLFYNTYKND